MRNISSTLWGTLQSYQSRVTPVLTYTEFRIAQTKNLKPSFRSSGNLARPLLPEGTKCHLMSKNIGATGLWKGLSFMAAIIIVIKVCLNEELSS